MMTMTPSKYISNNFLDNDEDSTTNNELFPSADSGEANNNVITTAITNNSNKEQKEGTFFKIDYKDKIDYTDTTTYHIEINIASIFHQIL
ncbi:hypothetical protein IV203_009605 [Nitzschia inconspicua]|uniref:Uncharacterized protein n=1 Tax=Nitzschia inconspicua TaxID=303405 RepID=A0A9K3PK44_9STRA|nr:hypothetical protein IV203_009605 [Nitzschia inconspicua]